MNHNVGTSDRIVRALAGLGMMIAGVMAPLPLPVRFGVLAATGGYLVLTSLIGACLGYRLISRSTCPARKQISH
jgi:phosphate/sulfate permease